MAFKKKIPIPFTKHYFLLTPLSGLLVIVVIISVTLDWKNIFFFLGGLLTAFVFDWLKNYKK